MTTNDNEIAAIAEIRDRAIEYATTVNEFRVTRPMSTRNLALIDKIDYLRISAPDDRETLLAHVDALTARLADVEAALKPFADVAQVVMRRDPLTDDRTYMSISDQRITYGDLRTAAALGGNGYA